ncbi:MAG: HAMP domain-containing histidine kinase [Phormidesmis sp. RL_2_1]|nr:HAMP domain-containing histidine kinase [Phormidesmis sp. RL_2_1]
MGTGAERITTIVRSLQTFSHLDESATKSADLHQGLDSAIFLVTSQMGATAHRPAITIIRHYGEIPMVYCYPGQLNQVFMGLLTNAIDALTPIPTVCALDSGLETTAPVKTASAPKIPTITITTDTLQQGNTQFVRIRFTDNGMGMSEAIRERIFDPFFTTKPVGAGMGLGLSMSYQIMVTNHKGKLLCDSRLGEGTTFTLQIPLNLKLQDEPAVPTLSVAAMPGMLMP